MLDAAEGAAAGLREQGLEARAICTDVTSEPSVASRRRRGRCRVRGARHRRRKRRGPAFRGGRSRGSALARRMAAHARREPHGLLSSRASTGFGPCSGSGGGSVVITASPTGLFGRARGFDAYSASKAGTYGLTRVMANDYARRRDPCQLRYPGVHRHVARRVDHARRHEARVTVGEPSPSVVRDPQTRSRAPSSFSPAMRPPTAPDPPSRATAGLPQSERGRTSWQQLRTYGSCLRSARKPCSNTLSAWFHIVSELWYTIMQSSKR